MKTPERSVYCGLGWCCGGDRILLQVLCSQKPVQTESVEKPYKECVIAMTIVQFSNWTFRTLYTFIDRGSVEQTAWIVPAPFRCVWYTNHVGYQPVFRAANIVMRWNQKMVNLSFVQIFYSVCLSEMRVYYITEIKALRKTNRGKELYLVHGSVYSLSNSRTSGKLCNIILRSTAYLHYLIID